MATGGKLDDRCMENGSCINLTPNKKPRSENTVQDAQIIPDLETLLKNAKNIRRQKIKEGMMFQNVIIVWSPTEIMRPDAIASIIGRYDRNVVVRNRWLSNKFLPSQKDWNGAVAIFSRNEDARLAVLHIICHVSIGVESKVCQTPQRMSFKKLTGLASCKTTKVQRDSIDELPLQRALRSMYNDTSRTVDIDLSYNPRIKPFQDVLSEVLQAVTSKSHQRINLDLNGLFLDHINYDYTRIYCIWCGRDMSMQDIPKLLECHSRTRYINVEIKNLNFFKLVQMESGILKFKKKEEAAVAQEIISNLKFVKVLPMAYLLHSIAEIEVSLKKSGSSKLIIISKEVQKGPIETKDLKHFLHKYGEIKSIQYIKKVVGKELIVQADYAHATQSFLAMAALDECYFKGIGRISAKFKESGINKDIIPEIIRHIQGFLKFQMSSHRKRTDYEGEERFLDKRKRQRTDT